MLLLLSQSLDDSSCLLVIGREKLASLGLADLPKLIDESLSASARPALKSSEWITSYLD